MPSSRKLTSPRFSVGDVVTHALFDYRGVVVDVDATFQLSDEWYEEVARSRPPKDAPWYHVIVEGSDAMRYVAQRNLLPDETGQPVRNPVLDELFAGFDDGRYRRRDRLQ
jgi:heat shock protein HspQ